MLPRLTRRTLSAGWCVATMATIAVMETSPAFADVYIYWRDFGLTWQVGVVPTTAGVVHTESGSAEVTSEGAGRESHMTIVCEVGRCGIVGDCKTCHTSPQPVTRFSGRVAQEHQRTHFQRATITVGSSPVPFGTGSLQMMSGRMVMLDKDRTPTFRLPADARLLRDTRTGQPLFIVYAGRSAPEPFR